MIDKIFPSLPSIYSERNVTLCQKSPFQKHFKITTHIKIINIPQQQQHIFNQKPIHNNSTSKKHTNTTCPKEPRKFSVEKKTRTSRVTTHPTKFEILQNKPMSNFSKQTMLKTLKTQCYYPQKPQKKKKVLTSKFSWHSTLESVPISWNKLSFTLRSTPKKNESFFH